MKNHRLLHKLVISLFGTFLLTSCQFKSATNHTQSVNKPPIIDVHIHAESLADWGDESLAFCVPVSTMIPHYDPQDNWFEVMSKAFSEPQCDQPIWSPSTDEELLMELLNQLEKHNIRAIVGGPPERVLAWQEQAPDRIIASIQLQFGRDDTTPEDIRTLVSESGFKVLGEVANQYVGIGPTDPRMDPYYAVAQELDIPVAIHLGSGSPGAPLGISPNYSVTDSNPLRLEPILKKFPKLRISVMHYGEPFVDEMIAMMYHYPHLYVDLGGIQWTYPEKYFFQNHLKQLIDSGFSKRIMFGSDGMIWPELIERSIAIINRADFLTEAQKRDIFYHNAVRFFRLDSE